MEELIARGLEQGLGYGLFIALLLYVLKTTGDRERKYQKLLETLSERLNRNIENVENDVKDIKKYIFKNNK
ncbi:MAG: BhlA/UviB family holin-like peptide [Clostridium sp.]